MITCSECKTSNPSSNKFCGGCGKELPAVEAVPVPGEPGVFYCHKHVKVPTRIRCGKCDAPVCIKCSVQGVAGIRCRECAKQRVKVRPVGVLHEAGRVIGNSTPGLGRTVWYMVLWRIIMSIFFRGGW